MRTLSELRRELQALRRKYHKELTIYHMRRVTEEIHHDYARAVTDRQNPPKPLEVIRRIAPGIPADHPDAPDELPGQGTGSGRHTRTPENAAGPAALGVAEQVRPAADAGTVRPGTQARPVRTLGPLVRHGLRNRAPWTKIKARLPWPADI